MFAWLLDRHRLFDATVKTSAHMALLKERGTSGGYELQTSHSSGVNDHEVRHATVSSSKVHLVHPDQTHD